MSAVVDDRSTTPSVSRPTDQGDPGGYVQPLRIAALATTLVVTWRVGIPMLLDGPRLDETLTAWVIADGLDDAIGRSWRFQGQSPLYFAGLWVWAQVAGSSFLALRLPSLIAMATAGWQLRRLATDLGLGRERDLVVGLFVLFSSVHVNAVTARPYAFLLLTVVLASRAGLNWSVSGRRSDALRWAALCALAAYFQPFAVYAIAAQFWWLVVRRRAGDSVGELLAPVVTAGVLVLPLAPQVWSLAQRQGGLAIVDVPSIGTFVSGMLPLAVLLGLVAGLLLSRQLNRRPELSDNAPFVLSAAFLPQIGLFVQSHLTGSGVLVAKYLAPATMGVALLAAIIVAHLTTRAAVLAATAFMLILPILELRPQRTHEWGVAVEFLSVDHPDAPVLAMTGFIEAADLSLLDDSEASAYLAAPLSTQGYRGDVLPLPLGTGPDRAMYIANLVDSIGDAEEISVVRTTAGVPAEQVAEETLAELGYREVARIEPRGLLVTVWNDQRMAAGR